MDIEQACEQVNLQRVYRRTYQALPSDINELNPDFIISLHCNAFNQEASGCEMLYYHRSAKGKMMAAILQNDIRSVLNNNDRGIKAKSAEDRGGFLLKYTNAPCVIAEPFFIDNNHELANAQDKYQQMVAAFAQSIESIASMFEQQTTQ